jgi:hypothetical protein
MLPLPIIATFIKSKFKIKFKFKTQRAYAPLFIFFISVISIFMS